MTLALLLTAVTGAWAEDTYTITFSANGKNKTYTDVALPAEYKCEYGSPGEFDNIIQELYGQDGGHCIENATPTVTGTDAITPGLDGPNNYAMITITAPFTGKATVSGTYSGWSNNSGSSNINYSIEVYFGTPSSSDAIDVNLNDDKTEASFKIPASDVTVNYELVRDMSVQMTATMGDGTDGLRYRVKKSEQNPGKYEPADMDMMQVLTLVAVNDGIEQKDLTLDEDYFCRIYKLDEQTQQPEGDGVELADFDFAPGLYALKAFATDGSNYDGETALSNTFKLFEGYELKIAAGEYATYYKDEALYVEDEDAKLYTITTVGNETATATELTVAAANTPLLVKNNAAEAKTILLIPTTNATPDDVTPYEGFKGTLEATQIAASTATQNNYALNGKEFVWVMDAIDIAANRAWLEIPATTTNSRALTIVFGDVTGLTTANIAKAMNGDWYTLDGIKLQAAPTKKGVYIRNGKKVVVK